jgi:hypothetical protein
LARGKGKGGKGGSLGISALKKVRIKKEDLRNRTGSGSATGVVALQSSMSMARSTPPKQLLFEAAETLACGSWSNRLKKKSSFNVMRRGRRLR